MSEPETRNACVCCGATLNERHTPRCKWPGALVSFKALPGGDLETELLNWRDLSLLNWRDLSGQSVAKQHLPEGSEARKRVPIATGCLDYFPDALAKIAELSFLGNEKHNPDEPLHWSRGKSNDHPDCLLRHFMDRGKVDETWDEMAAKHGMERVRHSVEMAWRALAIAQLEIEAIKGTSTSP